MTSAIDAYRQASGAYLRAQRAAASAPDEDGLGTAAEGSAASGSFADLVRGALDSTIQQQHQAEQQATSAVSGRGDLTAVVTSVAEAEVALQAVVAVRDRVVEAYKDVMRMPI